MNIKMRFWCPARKAFITDIRCWTSCDGNLYVISSKEEEVVSQLSTGCHDKNKTEIFEGDKINYGGSIGTVEFFAGRFQLDWGDQTDDGISMLTTDKMEVVGNTFEGISKLVDVVDAEDEENEEELDLSNCEQCGEPAWDGYICHVCGAKNI